jgi:hypothetical protein
VHRRHAFVSPEKGIRDVLEQAYEKHQNKKYGEEAQINGVIANRVELFGNGGQIIVFQR